MMEMKEMRKNKNDIKKNDENKKNEKQKVN